MLLPFIIVFTLYFFALVALDKISIDVRNFFNLFNRNVHSEAMEKFVASKNPQNTAEAEYWMREYTRKNLF